MEIERKFLVKDIPDLSGISFSEIEQGYICTKPVVRIRKRDDRYILTYKGSGLMAHEEIEANISATDYENLSKKIDGHFITKRRYLIPYDKYTIELDVFSGHMAGLVLAEVEFESVEEANCFQAPKWFAEDVTSDHRYHNNAMIFENPFNKN